MTNKKRTFARRGWALAPLVFAFAPSAGAFTHVVKPGETLAQIAARVYGDARKESLLAGANALDAGGGSAIVPGMRLEIPAPTHHKVAPGETWTSMSLTWLGDARRAEVLARANRAVSWIQPVDGLEVEIPAVVAHIVSAGESSTSLAARYWGDGNRGWELNAFNGRPEAVMHRGDIILVPLTDLALTDAGRAEGKTAIERTLSEVDFARLTAQRSADSELPRLLLDVRKGQYVEGVALANRILGSGELTRPQLAVLYRVLLEAYAALEAPAAAHEACASLRANDPNPRFDSTSTSPKIRAACPR
jgi:LysM repeat protein